MGANEKHAAAYHGEEYAPVTESVRERYMRDRFKTDWVDPVNSRAEFDRWLEGVRSEAKAEAFEGFAQEFEDKIRRAQEIYGIPQIDSLDTVRTIRLLAAKLRSPARGQTAETKGSTDAKK